MDTALSRGLDTGAAVRSIMGLVSTVLSNVSAATEDPWPQVAQSAARFVQAFVDDTGLPLMHTTVDTAQADGLVKAMQQLRSAAREHAAIAVKESSGSVRAVRDDACCGESTCAYCCASLVRRCFENAIELDLS